MDQNPTDDQNQNPTPVDPVAPAAPEQPAAPTGGVVEEKCTTCGGAASAGNCTNCGQNQYGCTCQHSEAPV